ncbi:hypothetical protein FJT64_001442 [Amphibalanus amphitrite]|uniref:Uncharacterized protein n=1 Tax=Amphibalanus amphitrite TaxID=1232801 RepID=A0A6A4V2I8_AMPAM|nr:hypothetical protein FJT64_001442 [Amphibalanus amphitrite]
MFNKVTTFGRSHRYTERLCGEWRSSVHHLEVRKSLFGACDPTMDDKYGYECTVREINLQAHVPRDAVSLQPSFEVVVTAYYNRELFMGCGAGRFLCLNRDSSDQTERCISQRLVCDGYPNCGFTANQDEYSSTCNQHTGTLTESDHFFATWAGFAVIVLLLVIAVSYFIRSVRWTAAREPAELRGRAARQPPPPRPGVPEPPPYETLYPQGPPSGFLEKKRERAGAEEAAAPPPAPLRPTAARREPAPAPQRHVLHGSARGAAGAAVTHIYVEPEEGSPEEPPPYTERPALRHSVLLAEAVP